MLTAKTGILEEIIAGAAEQAPAARAAAVCRVAVVCRLEPAGAVVYKCRRGRRPYRRRTCWNHI